MVEWQILIVEDDEGLNSLAQKALRRCGFNCDGVFTGRDAIKRVEQGNGLILLIDQRLPDMDGTELVNTLHDLGHQPPFIAMTGHGDENIAVKMMKLGARDYLVKSFDLPEMLPMVFKRLMVELETEQKLALAERKLRKNQEMYKALLENTKAIAYEIDLASLKFTYISPQISNSTGYPASAWTDFNFWAETLHPEDKDFCVNFCMEETKNGRDHEFEYRMVTADDRVLWFKDLVSLNKKGGKPISLRGSLIDITRQKKLEAQLQQNQKMESIGNLAGGIAHDFNNILFPIIGLSEIMMEDSIPGSDEYENASEIYKAGKRGSELVNQILAFSRQSEHKLIPVRIQNVLTEVLKLSRSSIPANIEIVHNIEKDCGLVVADSTQVHQIAMNLITNAYHAVEEKGGRISVELKEVTSGVEENAEQAEKDTNYIMLTVSDTGHGIAPDVINNIFDPYFTTKEKGKGTGLGLATVYGIVKEHHGEIKVNSSVGKGTTFEILFPLMKSDNEPVELKQADSSKGGSEKILLVDDEESIVLLVRKMLERLGYMVETKTDSIEALELFKTKPDEFDLVITDMTMPGMTGEKLAEKLLLARPDIPIIICTGFSERLNYNGNDIRGIQGILMKPVLKSDVAKTVRKVLDSNK